MHLSQDADLPLPDWLRFLSGLVFHPRQVASVCPSSRCLERHLARLPCLRRAQLVVELGPGLGGTTRALLHAMPKDSVLLGIEIVEQFANEVRRIPDARLRVVQGSALDLDQLLRSQRLSQPDVIVSGIPFSTMSREAASSLVRTIHAVLAAASTFVAYQVHPRVCELATEAFGAPQQTLVMANVPPLRIFEWRKPAEPESVGKLPG